MNVVDGRLKKCVTQPGSRRRAAVSIRIPNLVDDPRYRGPDRASCRVFLENKTDSDKPDIDTAVYGAPYERHVGLVEPRSKKETNKKKEQKKKKKGLGQR